MGSSPLGKSSQRRFEELFIGCQDSESSCFQASLRTLSKAQVAEMHAWNKIHDDPVYYPLEVSFARYNQGNTTIMYKCHDICAAMSEADHMAEVVVNCRIFIRDLVIQYGKAGFGPFDWPEDPEYWLGIKDKHQCRDAKSEPDIIGIKNVFLFVPLHKRSQMLKSEKKKVNVSSNEDTTPWMKAYVSSLSKEEYWREINAFLCNEPPPPQPDPIMDYILSSKSRVFQIDFHCRRDPQWTSFKGFPPLVDGYRPVDYPMARPGDVKDDNELPELHDLPGRSFLKYTMERARVRNAPQS